MQNLTARVKEQAPGFENEVVSRYTTDLLGLAGRRLPKQIQARFDPEDVVQSVYRSFFRRHGEGQFQLEGSDDLWGLLATITFRKVANARKFHLRERRNTRRERALKSQGGVPATAADEDIEVLWECLDELVRGMPERCRTILALRLEGHSIEQIVERVDRTRRTVLRVLASVTETATRMLDAPS